MSIQRKDIVCTKASKNSSYEVNLDERNVGNEKKIRHDLIDSHCHQERENSIDKKAIKKLIITSLICVFFMAIEVVGGILSNSLAIATDAAHLFTDIASFMISLFSIWLGSRPPTKRMTFGWHRAEVRRVTKVTRQKYCVVLFTLFNNLSQNFN